MDHQTDIVIIGGGLSSLAAAVALEGSGLEICLVQKALGASALSSGAWDLADSPVRFKGQRWDEFPPVSENIHELLRRKPYHPFNLFSDSPQINDLAIFLKEQSQKIAHALPLPMSGDGERPLVLPTCLGTLKPTALCQSSMSTGNLLAMKRARLLVVGILGYPEFRSAFIAQALEAFQSQQDKTHVEFIGSFDVPMPHALGTASLSATELANALDQEKYFVPFGKSIVDYIKGKVYTHLLLPPVLGFKNTAAILEALQKITGLKVSEALATPMSVPGWRQAEAIVQYFKKQEYDVIEGEVVAAEIESRQVKAVQIQQGKESFRLRARHFILATGKFFSGGLNFDVLKKVYQEKIFALPLSDQDKWVLAHEFAELAQPTPDQAQPFLSIGIKTNAQAQPLDQDHQIFADNLFAAGSILTGFDPMHERCGTGVDIISGTVAGLGCR